jgi:ABC-type dipeptide/oligopeptide/nickel transport system permease component
LAAFAKKAGALAVTLFLVSLVTFLAFNLLPGDPATAMLGTQATPAQLHALRAQLGLNEPLPQRYLQWLSAFVRGDPGVSIRYAMPVSALLADRIPVTLWLTALSCAMILVISLPLGVLSAGRRNRWAEAAVAVADQVTMAIPPFFLGMLLILVFGVIFRLFIPGAYVDYKTDFGGFLGYLILPALAIALPKSGMVVRFLRGSLNDQLHADYVRTARSKGIGGRALLYRHVLKNALIPVLALMGMIVADILAGSIIIEQVFGLPGVGRLLISSVTSRDFPLAQALVVYIALIVVVVNFLVDALFRLIDPRIRLR